MKIARTVWSGGKGGDNLKALPIAIITAFSLSLVQITGIFLACNSVNKKSSILMHLLFISVLGCVKKYS